MNHVKLFQQHLPVTFALADWKIIQRRNLGVLFMKGVCLFHGDLNASHLGQFSRCT